MADLTKADCEALELMPDVGWFNVSFHGSWRVRRTDYRCARLHTLGKLERRLSPGQIGWEYRKIPDGVARPDSKPLSPPATLGEME